MVWPFNLESQIFQLSIHFALQIGTLQTKLLLGKCIVSNIIQIPFSILKIIKRYINDTIAIEECMRNLL